MTTAWSLIRPIPLELILPLMLLSQPIPNSALHGNSGAVAGVWARAGVDTAVRIGAELEPGAYWPIPRGVNVVTAVNSFNWGDLAFDPSAPIDEASAAINTTAFSFTRAFNLAGRSANAGVVLPVVGGHVEGLYLGERAEAGRFGLGDPRVKLAMNLYGAPTMTPVSFASYRQGTILGVSVTAAPPLGQYDRQS
jgi:hypothetical protein